MKPKPSSKRVRSSVTGQFRPPDEAKRNPRETETERVKPRPKKKPSWPQRGPRWIGPRASRCSRVVLSLSCPR